MLRRLPPVEKQNGSTQSKTSEQESSCVEPVCEVHEGQISVTTERMPGGYRPDSNVAGYPAQISASPRNAERRVKPSVPMRVQQFASSISKRDGKEENSRGRLRIFSDNILSPRETIATVKKQPEKPPMGFQTIADDSIGLSESVAVLLSRHGVDVDLAGRGLETRNTPEACTETGQIANLEDAETAASAALSSTLKLPCGHNGVEDDQGFIGHAAANLEDTPDEQTDAHSSARTIPVDLDRCLEQGSEHSTNERDLRLTETLKIGSEPATPERVNICSQSPKVKEGIWTLHETAIVGENEQKNQQGRLTRGDATNADLTASSADTVTKSVVRIASTADGADGLRDGHNKDQPSANPWGIHTAEEEAKDDNNGSFIRSVHRGLRGASRKSKGSSKMSEVGTEFSGTHEEDIVFKGVTASADADLQNEEKNDGSFLRTMHRGLRGASKRSIENFKASELGSEYKGSEVDGTSCERTQSGSFLRSMHLGMRGASIKSQGSSKFLEPRTDSDGSKEDRTSVRTIVSSASNLAVQEEEYEEQRGKSRKDQGSREVHESGTESEGSEEEESTSAASDIDSQDGEDDDLYMDAFVRISTCLGGDAVAEESHETSVNVATDATDTTSEKSSGDRKSEENATLEVSPLLSSQEEEDMHDAPRSFTRNLFSPRRVLKPLGSMTTKAIKFPSQKSDNGMTKTLSFRGTKVSSMRSSDAVSLRSNQSCEEPSSPWGAETEVVPKGNGQVGSGKDKLLTSPISTGRLGIHSSKHAIGSTFLRPKRQSLDDGAGDEDNDDDDDDDLDNEDGPSREGLDDAMFGHRVSLIYDDFVDYDSKAKRNAKQSPLSKWRQKQAQFAKEKNSTSPLSKSRFFAKTKVDSVEADSEEDDEDDDDDLDNEDGPSREGMGDATFGRRVSLIYDDFVDYDSKAKRNAKQSAFDKLRESKFRKTFKGPTNRP